MTAARFFGGLLMAVGVMVAGLSGLCTIVFLAMSLPPNGASMIPLVLIIGGPPIAIGLGLIFGGRVLWRHGAPPDPKALEIFDDPPPP
jgi:hypothetical protein